MIHKSSYSRGYVKKIIVRNWLQLLEDKHHHNEKTRGPGAKRLADSESAHPLHRDIALRIFVRGLSFFYVLSYYMTKESLYNSII